MTIKNKSMKLALIALALLVAVGAGYSADAAKKEAAKKTAKPAAKKSEKKAEKKMSKMVPAKDIKWMPIPGSKAEIAVIWGDPSKGANGRMFKIPGGVAFPAHKHTGDYNAVLISGTWQRTAGGGKPVDLPTGSYVFQMGGEFHTDKCVSKETCIIYSTQDVAADYIPKEMPKKEGKKKKEPAKKADPKKKK